MGTLLTTSRMSPELAERVRASVGGRRRAPPARYRAYSVASLRAVVLLAIAALATTVLVVQRRARERLERDRAALLARVRQEAASLTPHEKAAPARVRAWLERCSGPYAGDLVMDELRAPEAFDATLRRSIVYVRGTLASFQNPDVLMETAALSFRDAFAGCLVEPPVDRSEKRVLKAALRSSSEPSGGERSNGGAEAPRIARFYHALYGVPFLLPSWEERVLGAAAQPELDRLTRVFERAPLEQARRAARSELLLFAMDEPSDAPGPTELDGERPHPVRVGLVDLAASRVLFQLRRRVDPSWLSATARAEHASAADSCALAFDVRAELLRGAERSGGG